MIGVINEIIYIIKQKLGIDSILLNQGKLLSEIYFKKKINYLDEASFKVFSQWGEDGIIQYIINIMMHHVNVHQQIALKK